MYRIGIDLGGTNIAVGVVDDRHQIVAEASVPAGAHRPAEQVVADMCRAVELALVKEGLSARDCVSIGVDDNALCILRMSGGALGTMAASWTIYGHECQSTCLYGTKGIMLIYNEASAPITVSDLEGNTTSYNLDVPHNGTGVIDEFVDALVHDRDPEVSGREALTVMRTIFASINSSNISRTVAVNSDFVTHF